MIPTGTKFIGISPNVNLKEKKSAVLNAETQPYTLDDIRGYKVYTALLTQSGGDDPIGQYSDELVIGRTYTITDFVDGDFTIVGAPNNDTGTSFVATGTNPNWGTSGDNIVTYNTGAPVVTVLENTIGNIWFSYNDVGQYQINSDELFVLNKIFFPVQTGFALTFDTGNKFGLILVDSNLINLQSVDAAADYSNNSLQNTPIEIRVYN